MQGNATDFVKGLASSKVAPHQLSFTTAGLCGVMMLATHVEGCDVSYYIALTGLLASAGLGTFQYGVNNTLNTLQSFANTSGYYLGLFKQPSQASDTTHEAIAEEKMPGTPIPPR